MAHGPKIAFIGAGSTVFMKNIVGDILQRPALGDAHIALMDIDEARLEESQIVAQKIISTLGVGAQLSGHTSQRAALDFELPKSFGLRQTIADTLGIGGIMRGLRTVPHLWSVCEDMRALCPDAILLQYVNPMAINTWAIAEKFPDIRQVGLCHSVQGTAEELAWKFRPPPCATRSRASITWPFSCALSR